MPSILELGREACADAASAPVRSLSTIVTLAFMYAAIGCVGSLALNTDVASHHARTVMYARLEVVVAPAALGSRLYARDLRRFRAELAALPAVTAIVPEIVVPVQLASDSLRTAAPTFVESYSASEWAQSHCPADRIFLGAEFAAIHRPDRFGYVTVLGNQLAVCGVRHRRYDMSDFRASVGPAVALALLRQVVPPDAQRLPAPGMFNVFSLRLRDDADIARVLDVTEHEPELLFADPRPQVRMSESAAQVLRGVGAAVAILVGFCCFVVTFNSATSSVVERTPELGVRRAVGARSRDVVTAIVVESNILCLGACAGGAVVSYAAGSLLEAVLSRAGAGGFFAIQPPAMAAAAAVMFAILDVAVILPALRASRITVTDALRR